MFPLPWDVLFFTLSAVERQSEAQVETSNTG